MEERRRICGSFGQVNISADLSISSADLPTSGDEYLSFGFSSDPNVGTYSSQEVNNGQLLVIFKCFPTFYFHDKSRRLSEASIFWHCLFFPRQLLGPTELMLSVCPQVTHAVRVTKGAHLLGMQPIRPLCEIIKTKSGGGQVVVAAGIGSGSSAGCLAGHRGVVDGWRAVASN